jgi:hypothetical protein
MIFLIIGAVILVSLSFWGMAGGFKREQDPPGPHNNWRKNTGNHRSSGWGENHPGFNGDGFHQSGHSGGGGGFD